MRYSRLTVDGSCSCRIKPPFSTSLHAFFDHYLSNAHTAEHEAVKNSGVGKSAKVVLGRVLINDHAMSAFGGIAENNCSH